MDRETRRETARKICRRVTECVGRVATPGIGYWAPAWDLVREPSERFMEAVHQWEVDGTKEAEATVKEASNALVRAWREANRRFLDTESKGRVTA